jgi:hypothetical protein
MTKCKYCNTHFDNHSNLATHLRFASTKCPNGFNDDNYKEKVSLYYKKNYELFDIKVSDELISNLYNSFMNWYENKLEEERIESYNNILNCIGLSICVMAILSIFFLYILLAFGYISK